jgi:NAD(P)-dependent dehydrogenase (short-subunit alcohol dehydrogenase family)
MVNNAGFGTNGAFAELDADGEEEEIRLNVVALVRLTRAALPGMIARGHGRILNVSSMAGFQPGPFMATYGATKAYVNSFTEALHEELRGTGVRRRCVPVYADRVQERAGIDASGIPSFAWMTPEVLVDSPALRRGEVVASGVGNRPSPARSVRCRSAVRRISSVAVRRFLVRRYRRARHRGPSRISVLVRVRVVYEARVRVRTDF